MVATRATVPVVHPNVLNADYHSDGITKKVMTAEERTKLSGIEEGADVTDATNVDAAGAVMNTDTATTDMQFVGTGSDLSQDGGKLAKREDVKANLDTKSEMRGLQARTAIAHASVVSDLEPGDVVSGVTLVAGDVVLVYAHLTPTGSGVYVVQASGSALRHPMMNVWSELPGALVSVAEGDFAGTLWRCTVAAGGTIGTTPITFAQQAPVANALATMTANGTVNNTAAFLALLDGPKTAGFVELPEGTYYVDPITLTKKVKVRAHSRAVVKQRALGVTTGGVTGCWLTFGPGSEGSVWEGGVFDGNKSSLASGHTGAAQVGIAVKADNVRFEPDVMQNFCDAPFWLAAKGFRSKELYGQDNGGTIAIGYSYRDGATEVIRVNAYIGVIRAYDTNNNGLAIAQHGVDAWGASGRIGLIDVQRLGGDSSGTSVWTSGFTTFNCKGLTIGETRVKDFTSDTLVHHGVSHIAGSLNCDWGDIYVENLAGGGVEIGVGYNIRHGDIFVDGKYRSSSAIALANTFGVDYNMAGRYPDGNLIRWSVNGSHGIRGGRVRVVRTGTAGLIRSGDSTATFECEGCVGAWGWGFVMQAGSSSFAKAPTDIREHRIVVPYIQARNCHSNGVIANYIRHLVIKGGLIEGCGQNTSLADNARVGFRATYNTANQAAPGRLSVENLTYRDGQNWSVANAISFKPGTTDADNRYTFTRARPFEVGYGQYIKLTGATAGGDVVGWVWDITLDEITLQFASAQTFVETGNLTALTGTYSSSGATLTGTSTDADDELPGPFWIKADGEYRQALRALTDTAVTVDQAFTAPLSGDTVERLEVDVSGVPSQTYHEMLIVTGGTSALEWFNHKNNTLENDWLVAPTDFPTGILSVLADGSRYPRYKAANVTTTGTTTEVWADIPRGHMPVYTSYQVTTDITTATTTAITLRSSSDTLLTTHTAAGARQTKNSASNGRWAQTGLTSDGSKIRLDFDGTPGAGAYRMLTQFEVHTGPTFAAVP